MPCLETVPELAEAEAGGSQKGVGMENATLPALDIRQTLFSPDRAYRYTLWRQWDMFNATFLQVIGLNPSTATETTDDPTVRRCIGFATAWGYGGLCMTNLLAYRSTDPQPLRTIPDPVGPGNLGYLVLIATQAAMTLVAWGGFPSGLFRSHVRRTLRLLPSPVFCLGTTRKGWPLHPLYVPKTRLPIPYDEKECLYA